MAENYQVGDLKIVFDALDNTDKQFQTLADNLEKISKAILTFTKENIANIPKLGNKLVKLSDTISSIDVASFGNKIQDISERLQPFLSSLNASYGALVALSNIMKINAARAKALVDTVDEEARNANDAAESTTDLAGGLENVNEATKKGIKLKAKATKGTKKSTKETKESTKETKKSESALNKLSKSILRISLYRTIRRGLQLIVESAKDTINAFATVDDSVNDVMSSITSSFQVISLSAGSVLIPLLETIAPILQEIAQGAADFANTILQATATGDTYWAINAEAIQNYREQLQESSKTLASFDKINTLNGKSNNSIFLEKKEVDKSSSAVKDMQLRIEHIKKTIQELWNVISAGWTKIVIPLFDILSPYIDGFITGIGTIISRIGEALQQIQGAEWVEPFLKSVLVIVTALVASKIITGIKTLVSAFNAWGIAITAIAATVGILSNWDNFNAEAKRTITTVSLLIAGFTALASAILIAQGAATMGTAIPLILTAASAGVIGIKGLINMAKGYADGGVPAKGTLFYAGEAGAETVTVGANGRTEVTNVSQMEDALYNAIIRANKQGEVSKQPINLYIDGRKILEATQKSARSQGLDFRKI